MPSALWFWLADIDGNSRPPLTLAEWFRLMRPLWLRELSRPNPFYEELMRQNPGTHKVGATLRIRLPADFKVQQSRDLVI